MTAALEGCLTIVLLVALVWGITTAMVYLAWLALWGGAVVSVGPSWLGSFGIALVLGLISSFVARRPPA